MVQDPLHVNVTPHQESQPHECPVVCSCLHRTEMFGPRSRKMKIAKRGCDAIPLSISVYTKITTLNPFQETRLHLAERPLALGVDLLACSEQVRHSADDLQRKRNPLWSRMRRVDEVLPARERVIQRYPWWQDAAQSLHVKGLLIFDDRKENLDHVHRPLQWQRCIDGRRGFWTGAEQLHIAGRATKSDSDGGVEEPQLCIEKIEEAIEEAEANQDSPAISPSPTRHPRQRSDGMRALDQFRATPR